jgi:hypothetical protein
MSNALKPCPFCGSAAGFAGGLYSYRVKCRECFAQTGLYVTEDLAANHWNTRTVSCDDAQKYADGTCLGYQRGENDDEPCEQCKNCPQNEFYEENANA